MGITEGTYFGVFFRTSFASHVPTWKNSWKLVLFALIAEKTCRVLNFLRTIVCADLSGFIDKWIIFYDFITKLLIFSSNYSWPKKVYVRLMLIFSIYWKLNWIFLEEFTCSILLIWNWDFGNINILTVLLRVFFILRCVFLLIVKIFRLLPIELLVFLLIYLIVFIHFKDSLFNLLNSALDIWLIILIESLNLITNRVYLVVVQFIPFIF